MIIAKLPNVSPSPASLFCVSYQVYYRASKCLDKPSKILLGELTSLSVFVYALSSVEKINTLYYTLLLSLILKLDQF